MQVRTPQDIGHILADARRRRRWSQSELAAAAGVSRQWVSMVENGKTSVEFHLVVSALHALGCVVHVTPRSDVSVTHAPQRPGPVIPSHSPSKRAPLTRRGKPLKSRRSRTDGS